MLQADIYNCTLLDVTGYNRPDTFQRRSRHTKILKDILHYYHCLIVAGSYPDRIAHHYYYY